MNELEYQLILKIRELKIFDEIGLIVGEYESACHKHPNWPEDIIHASAIIAEESGETVRAALNYVYESGSATDIRKEAQQTGAMCIRLINNLFQPVKNG